MKLRPVASAWSAAAIGVSKRAPKARMSWAKTSPNWSSRTLPTKPVRAPSPERPPIEFATDPPEIACAGPIAA